MVPRECFSRWSDALQHLVDTVPTETRCIAVDAGSPPDVSRRLRAIAETHDVLLIRIDEVLPPNECRLLALPHVDTRFTVFIDNDAFGAPGWLQQLEQCANETSAWAVGPVYSIGSPEAPRVHMAGGTNHLVERDGRIDLEETHLHADGDLTSVLAAVEKGPTELIELHCALVRTDALSAVGLDTGYLSMFEHNALCLEIVRAGGSIWLEPEAVVNYWPQDQPTEADRAFFAQRWSAQWNRLSAQHLAHSYGIAVSDVLAQPQFRFANNHRFHVSRLRSVAARLPAPLRSRLGATAAAIDRRRPVRERSASGPAETTRREPVIVNLPHWAYSGRRRR